MKILIHVPAFYQYRIGEKEIFVLAGYWSAS